MSRENLEVLRRLNEAFNRRDVDAAIQCLDPEVELHPGIQVPDEESRYLGRDGLIAWFRNATDPWETIRVEHRELIDAPDDRVLAVERWVFRGRDGIELSSSFPTSTPSGTAWSSASTASPTGPKRSGPPTRGVGGLALGQRSALMLAQSRGLQGPVAVAVTLAAHDQSVAERPQCAIRMSNSAPLALPTPVTRTKASTLSSASRPLRHGRDALEHLGAIAEEADDVVEAAYRPLADTRIRDPFRGRMHEAGDRLGIPVVHCTVEAPDGLDVLRRHRAQRKR